MKFPSAPQSEQIMADVWEPRKIWIIDWYILSDLVGVNGRKVANSFVDKSLSDSIGISIIYVS